MSYYLYKKKLYIGSNGRFLPLALYADSSIRDGERKHPYHWCIMNIVEDGYLLASKTDWEKAREELLQRELERLEGFRTTFEPENTEKASKESYCYSGNSYPGGKKVKNMYSFFSCRNTIDAKTYFDGLTEIEIVASYCDRKTYSTIKDAHFYINSTEGLEKADGDYHQFWREMPEDCIMCLGIYGVR